jgi:hypothetical protein
MAAEVGPSTMSKLRVAGDDHADAAGKHVADARALLDNHRYDGAGYLSGYVVDVCPQGGHPA